MAEESRGRCTVWSTARIGASPPRSEYGCVDELRQLVDRAHREAISSTSFCSIATGKSAKSWTDMTKALGPPITSSR
jgi:hypothetical protein